MSDTKEVSPKLFQPIRIGGIQLDHRVILAPLTRFRADAAHVPTPMMVKHYAQRASAPGTLLITEGTLVAAKAGGYDNVPGIWSDAQVEGWKKVVDAVHAHGSFIYMQLWAMGRAALHSVLSQPDSPKNPGGPYQVVSASSTPLSTSDQSIKPHALTHDEILEYIDLHAQAAYNAVHRAGFDGVEIHCAHGYLIEQFLDDRSNSRTDAWGGSIENRIRLALEIIKKVVSVVGEERTGIRLSPFSAFQDMRMEHPYPTFAQLVTRVREAYPRFAFIHVVEPRISGSQDSDARPGESNDFLRAIWKGPHSAENGSVYLSAGGYKPESALEHAQKSDELVVFGRYFISNPDLPARIKKGIALSPYDRQTFYGVGKPEGYIDQPFADTETEARYEESKSQRV